MMMYCILRLDFHSLKYFPLIRKKLEYHVEDAPYSSAVQSLLDREPKYGYGRVSVANARHTDASHESILDEKFQLPQTVASSYNSQKNKYFPEWGQKGTDQQMFIKKSISRKIAHLQSSFK